jgi:putative PIN family toxin of toxin-antitoxin system
MKVVVDTNVFISAVWRDKNPEAVILWILNQPNCEWLVSPEIMEEYEEVLHRSKFSFSPETLNKWEPLLHRDTRHVRVNEQIDFPRDQKDAKFIACALANDADYLITGDRDFNEVREIANITILSVSQFKRFIIDGNADRT